MHIPKKFIPYLRTNHSGETGAVFIYRGILCVIKDQEVKNFAMNHLKTESEHLEKLEKIIPKSEKSKLLTLWKFFGFITGFIPALIGKRFVFATIYYVETFVEKHYEEQILLLKKYKSVNKLKNLLKNLKDDEITHKTEALSEINNLNTFIKLWGKTVQIGSKLAVFISYKI